MSQICSKTARGIAKGEVLTPEMISHLSNCSACRELRNHYEEIEYLVMDVGAEPPADFADRIMARISEEAVSSPMLNRQGSVFLDGLRSPGIAYLSIGLASGISFFNIFRFLFFVLVPN